jgi:hypothetical protein
MRNFGTPIHDEAEDRDRFVPLFPRGMRYLREWRTLGGFLVLVVPVVVSAAGCFRFTKVLLASAAVMVFGLGFAFALIVEIASGIASDSGSGASEGGLFLHGTATRDRSPFAYWFQVLSTAIAYLAIVVTGIVMGCSAEHVE